MTVLAGSDDPWERARKVRSVTGSVVLGSMVVGVLVAGVWAWRELSPHEPTTVVAVARAYATPEATVRAYYRAVKAGDAASGLALVAPSAQQRLADGAASDFRNVLSLTALVVDLAVVPTPAPSAAPSPTPSTAPATPSSPGASPSPVAVEDATTVLVPVSFEAQYRYAIYADSGPQKRVVVLTRTGTGGVWRIIAIRTS